MVSTRKKKQQIKKILRQLKETLNYFIVGKVTNADAIENETLERQSGSVVNSFGRSLVGSFWDYPFRKYGTDSSHVGFKPGRFEH